jgi:uncharacterized membrane protein
VAKPTRRQYGAARDTWAALGSETPVADRLDKAVEAAVAQAGEIGWPGVVLVLGVALLFALMIVGGIWAAR